MWKGLEWMWDVAGAPMMVCMEDIYFVFFSSHLSKWAGNPPLAFAELESAVGLMLFLAAGFSLGGAQVACLRGPLTEHATAAAAVGKHRFACPFSSRRRRMPGGILVLARETEGVRAFCLLARWCPSRFRSVWTPPRSGGATAVGGPGYGGQTRSFPLPTCGRRRTVFCPSCGPVSPRGALRRTG